MKTAHTILMLIACALAFPSFSQDAVFSANTKALLLQTRQYSPLKCNTAQVSAELKQFYPVRTIENLNFHIPRLFE